MSADGSMGMPSVPLVNSPHAEPRRTPHDGRTGALCRRIRSGWKKLKEKTNWTLEKYSGAHSKKQEPRDLADDKKK